MTVKSRWQCTIPQCSFLTCVFTSPTHPLPKTPLYIDALSPTNHYLTTHSYRSTVVRIASGLISCGLLPGDRVLLSSGNNIYFPTVFTGIIAAGGVFTGANPTFTARELAYQLKDSEAKFLLVSVGSIDVGIEAAKMVGLDPEKVFVFDDGLYVDDDGGIVRWATRERVKGLRHWSDIVMAGNDKFAWEELITEEEANRTAAINYSSGTTGVPKGVEITHYNFTANAQQNVHIYNQSQMPDSPPPRWLCAIPMYHAYGQTYFVTIAPVRRIPTWILPKFDFNTFLSCVEQFKITNIGGVPPIMVALAKHPDVAKYNLSSVVNLGCGAAPLSREISRAVEERVSRGRGLKENINLKQGWGMTEATCSVMGFHPDDRDEDGSIGEVFPNCEAKVMDAETGTKELSVYEKGEIWVRGPNVMKGYYKNPKATREIITEDGWLKTGDIGYYNEQKKWYIVDRKKELIKVKGNQVAPAELEGLLLENSGIADAAVIGIAYAEDERPRAYIVPKPGASLTADDVKKWVSERASRHKWLTGGVVLVKEVPRNPSGKILKRVLRDRAKTEVVDTADHRAKL
ncbi:hypothetical protein DFP73DRAFT_288277 [Morchella snyderi]|nr:hypothetical protein DFP73DRAFT_288277 [Morchella snyderi]